MKLNSNNIIYSQQRYINWWIESIAQWSRSTSICRKMYYLWPKSFQLNQCVRDVQFGQGKLKLALWSRAEWTGNLTSELISLTARFDPKICHFSIVSLLLIPRNGCSGAGGEISWWQLKNVGDDFGYFSLTTTIVLHSVASGTNIQKMIPTSQFSHQHPQIGTNQE